MSHLFLSEADLDGFRRWKYNVVDKSFTTSTSSLLIDKNDYNKNDSDLMCFIVLYILYTVLIILIIYACVSTVYLGPFWNWIVQYVPKECAPNVLTLAGFLSAIQVMWCDYATLCSCLFHSHICSLLCNLF